jgi:hypothetical protein
MLFYLEFWMSYGRLVAENNLLKKRLEESHTNLARLQETQSRREKEVAEDNIAAQVRIRDLESKLEALQTIFEGILKDHLVIYVKFISAREETDRLNVRLLDAANEMAIYRNKFETLSQSVKAKERLREYKEKAQSFYRQLTFASWGRDTGFSMGYMGGFESFREWVKKPGNFLKVETVSSEDVVPLKGRSQT